MDVSFAHLTHRVGLMTRRPSGMRPTCTPATGCARGMLETATAAEAAQMAMGSGQCTPS